ncbi:hypothetical protein PAHAL_1G026800 [Panicum hallii]|uniref:Uncharacterized protein n=1 Tax=Panicum hallii TaxID=206008 RepID=A0A2T8KTR8_9POAL|nr:hypothetical protein PAHAL_1G026800 [Panicum hallii]
MIYLSTMSSDTSDIATCWRRSKDGKQERPNLRGKHKALTSRKSGTVLENNFFFFATKGRARPREKYPTSSAAPNPSSRGPRAPETHTQYAHVPLWSLETNGTRSRQGKRTSDHRSDPACGVPTARPASSNRLRPPRQVSSAAPPPVPSAPSPHGVQNGSFPTSPLPPPTNIGARTAIESLGP